MKNLSFLKYLFFLGIAVFLIPACGEDDTGGGGGSTTAPSVELLAGAGLATDSIALNPGETFTVQVQAFAGEADLNSLEVLEDFLTLDVARIVSISGVTTPNNPQLITGDDVNGFTWDITIEAQAEQDTRSYDFEVTDVNGQASFATLVVSTESTATDPPTISYNGQDPFETTIGSLSGFNLDVVSNGNVLNSIAVYEDGVLINDLTRLRYTDGSTEFTSNPYTLPAADQDGFSGSIFVRAIEGSHTLTFEVDYGANETVSTVVNYTTAPIGTPLTGEFVAKIVYNADGPFFGGLDLDTGEVVSALSSDADIVDSGIDGNGDWFQTIEPANGADLVYVEPSMETFTYESVVTKEAIADAYVNGTNVLQSGTVEVGDMFVANANGVNYLLVVRDINFTASDNEDSYTFDIKY